MEALSIHDPALRARLAGAFLTPTAYPEATAVLSSLKAGGLGGRSCPTARPPCWIPAPMPPD